MFGDSEAYKNKFKTCKFEVENMAAKSFLYYFIKKRTLSHCLKSIESLPFKTYNLYTYHCFMEIFKILKFQDPSSMHSLYKLSTRYTSDTLIITPVPSIHFVYINQVTSWIQFATYFLSHWTKCQWLVSLSQTKSNLKRLLLQNQHHHHHIEWLKNDQNNFESPNQCK